MLQIKAVIGRLKGEKETTVQTVIFAPKSEWTQEKAAAWLEKHDFHASKVDETEDSYRFRQREPEEFENGSFRTIEMMSEAPRFLVDLGSLALAEAEKLVRIPLAILGRFVKGAQKFAIGRADLAKLVENFRKRKTGDLVIDYEHASEFPELAQGQAIPAAGWLKQIEEGPDERGILWGLAEFTSRAREMIASKEYKYLSPAIDWGARDKGTGAQQGATLTSVALVNRPFLEAMPAVQLSEGWEVEPQMNADERRSKEKEERKAMPTVVRLAEDRRVQVTCGECGKESLSAEALPKPEEPKVVRLSDVKRDKEGRLDFASLAVEGLIAAEVIQAMEAQRELDAAVAAGKITPAQRSQFEKLALSDLAGFKELVKTLPVQVDLSEKGFAGEGGGQDIRRVDARIGELTRQKMGGNSALTYGQAMKLVLSENPDLAREKSRLMRS